MGASTREQTAAGVNGAGPVPAGAGDDVLTRAERMQLLAARAILRLPPGAKRMLAGAPMRRDGLELDLDMQLLLRLEARDPRPPLSHGTAEDARASLRRSVRSVAGTELPPVAVRETTIAGAAGPLAARLYEPREAATDDAGALIVYYHGGGWVVGDLDTHDQPCRLLATAAGARVLSVDYRLAPENPFPAPVDDAVAAFRAAVAEAGRFRCHPARVAVAGDSAGAHLAAVTALVCAGDGGPAPAFQLLIYPVTDCVETAASRETFADGFVLTKENMDWYEDQFVGPAGDRRDPRISPLLAPELAGLAPALVVSAGFDPLRDEGEAYARRLRDAGVRTILRRYPGYLHGFTHVLIGGPGPRLALAEMGGVARAALAR
jgi:acetyl esterase